MYKFMLLDNNQEEIKKNVQEAAYEGETEVDEVVGKHIKRRK